LGEAVSRGSNEPRPGARPDLSRLSIIIPAYNEEEGIGDTVARLRAACPAAEIVVVDDGSTDGTRAIVLRPPDVRLVSHRRNRGCAARIVTGEPIPVLNSGLRCFRRDVLRRYLHLLPDGFSASTTSTLMMLKGGHRVGYVPIVARPRLGHSSVKIVSDGLRTLHLIVRIVVLFGAFRVFSVLGLGVVVRG